MPFCDLARRDAKELAAGVTARTFWAEQLLLSRVSLAAGSAVPAHAHPHEQAIVVLQGALDLAIDGERHTLRAGDMFLIPGNVEHAVTVGAEGCEVVDVFSPIRESLQY
jgi:quercetin dioxygenase-like cupin family protein